MPTAVADTPPAWNLSDLYAGIDDPQIDADLTRLQAQAKDIATAHKGQLAAGNLSATALHDLLVKVEALYEGMGRLGAFAGLVFAADTRPAAHGALETRIQEAASAVHAQLLFLDLEWAALPANTAQTHLDDPALAPYRHHLTRERDFAPYRRSEGEEIILDRKANTGARALCRLFDETLARMRLNVELPDGPQELSEENTLSLLHHSDRATRKAAADALTTGLDEHGHLLTFLFNTRVADHALDTEIRDLPGPMASRNLANEIPPESVAALLDACARATPMVADYYRLKSERTGLSPLYDYDRYAPIGEPAPVPYADARRIVLDGFGDFSPDMAQIAERFFTHGWIDAAPRDGKRGGAFAHPVTSDTHPYVFLNYTGTARDVMTLAHELGHGVHQWLARDRGYFGSDTPLTTAETASVFGEMLVFSALQQRQKTPEDRLALLCGKLEDTFSTVFRQAAMTRFEIALHAARGEGELATAQIDALWMDANRPMFGDSVVLRDDYAGWWRYIPHFIHTPFYCYAYAYGELLVLSLYAQYRREGEAFVPRYLELLAAGGSERPEVLLKRLGMDVTDPAFWDGGLAMMRGWVDDAIALAAEISTGR